MTLGLQRIRLIGLGCGLVWSVMAGVVSLAAAPITDPLVAIRHLPANNPYRAPLEKFLNLPEEQRTLLAMWAQKPKSGEALPPSLTAEQRAWVADLGAAVLAAAHQPQAAEWPAVPDPADPENPMGMTIPHVGAVNQLARIVNHSAADLAPGEAIGYYAAVAQLGRQVRTGGTLIDQLTGVAVEGLAIAETSRRLGEFSGADLDKLTASWAALKSAPGIGDSLRGERDLFFKPLLEKIIKPGLAAMIAEENELSGTSVLSQDGVGAGLRLAAIINDGHRMIGLEDRSSGTSFFVEEGKTVNGVAVLSIDFDRSRAMLRVHGKDAVLDLVSKRIVERRADARRLMRLFGMMDGMSSNQDGNNAKSVSNLLKRVQAHPGCLDDYIKQLQENYDAGITGAMLRAEQPKMGVGPKLSSSDDPLLALLAPTSEFELVARLFKRAELTTKMLDAAVGLRRQQLSGAPSVPAVDPWSQNGEGFRLTATPDGGFILSSIYEGRSGKPVEYKYATPDAGLVRR